jgi:glutamate formiminotransferase
MLQSAINVSEGRDEDLVRALVAAGGPTVVDCHSDPFHHRSVLTLLGDADAVVGAALGILGAARSVLDLTGHEGVHPRYGVVDVVPFTPFLPHRDPSSTVNFTEASAAATAFVEAAASLGQSTVTYGLGGSFATLPELRRHLRTTPPPDLHAGVVSVGVRDVLVAYNVVVTGLDRSALAQVASAVRSPELRTLPLILGAGPDAVLQVSCNVVAPFAITLDVVVDRVIAALPHGASVVQGELVGLLPAWALTALPPGRWPALGVSPLSTLEAHLKHS